MRHPHILWRLLRLLPWHWFRKDPATRYVVPAHIAGPDSMRLTIGAHHPPQNWRGQLSQRELKTKRRNRAMDRIQRESRRRNRTA